MLVSSSSKSQWRRQSQPHAHLVRLGFADPNSDPNPNQVLVLPRAQKVKNKDAPDYKPVTKILWLGAAILWALGLRTCSLLTVYYLLITHYYLLPSTHYALPGDQDIVIRWALKLLTCLLLTTYY